jgi:hypothetical protein
VFKIPAHLQLSSKGMRLRPTTMVRPMFLRHDEYLIPFIQATFMLNLVRDVLDVDVAFLCGGNIRGDKDYGDVTVFTFCHLKGELPFDTRISICPLPGWLICKMISYCRSFALETPPVMKGCYMQTDDAVKWDRDTNAVLQIGGEAVEMDRLYRCAINCQILEGVDSIVPLLDYLRDTPDDHSRTIDAAAQRRSSMELRNIIVGYCTKQTISQLLSAHSFKELDVDGDGALSDAELVNGLELIALHKTTTVLTLHNTVHMADHTHSHHLSKEELCKFALCVNAVQTKHLKATASFEEFHSEVEKYCGSSDAATLSLAHKLFDQYDVEKIGRVSMKYMASTVLTDAEIDAVVT